MAETNSTSGDSWDDDWDKEFDDVPTEDTDDRARDTSTAASPPSSAAPPASSDDSDEEDDDTTFDPSDFATERATRGARSARPARRANTGSRRGRNIETAPADQEPAQGSTVEDVDDELTVEDVQKDERKRGARGCALVAIACIVLVAMLGGLFLFLFKMTAGGDESSAQPPESSLTASASTPTAESSAATTPASGDQVKKEVAAKCVAGGDDKAVVGNDAGDRKSGPGVIKAFDHAYYVERSGKKAHEVLDPGLKGTTEESLQKAIDDLPEGTGHCLWITETEKDNFDVKLGEYIPEQGDVKEVIHEQKIRVAEKDGTYTIVGITNG